VQVPVPESALDAIRRFCDSLTPTELRNQMRIGMAVDGNRVTLSDERPPWDGKPGDWTSAPFAQLRYQRSTAQWTLWWANSNDRWHRYDGLGPSPDVGVLIAEIEDDPTCIFFG
jgi:hypothetical protein